MHSFFLRLLFGICAALGPVAMRAAEPAAKSKVTPAGPSAAGTKPAPPAATVASPPGSDVLTLPKMEVTTRRLKELDRTIKKLDKAIAREKKNMKASDLDKALNNDKLAKAAALFGGNSSAHMEDVAATRVMYMAAERDLLIELKQPRTLDEFTMLQGELERIRAMQRDLDKADH